MKGKHETKGDGNSRSSFEECSDFLRFKIKQSCKLRAERIPRNIHKLVEGRLEHEVAPKTMLICDLFHTHNLSMNHVSIAVFGNTIRYENRQTITVNFCRIYSILLCLILSNARLMDNLGEKIQKNLPKKIPIKVTREIIQRWMVSQRNFSWVIET